MNQREIREQWWRHSVVYEIPVHAFADSNGDGVGDLAGIASKLDYLEWLGIDCIWILPFYPSPLVDGGYDVSDLTLVLHDTIVMGDFANLAGQALYNPSSIRLYRNASGAERLAVVCGDNAFGASPQAAVVVLDPRALAIEHVIPLGATAAAAGELALTADGKLYVGSAISSEVYEVDLHASTPVATRHSSARAAPRSTRSAPTSIFDLGSPGSCRSP